MDPSSARALVQDVLSSTLGRRAKEHEIDDFVAMVQQAQEDNPSVTRETTRYNAEGTPVRSRSVSTGGVDAGQLVREKVMETPEYASVQAAGVYFPLLEQALDAVTDVEGL
jgi:hypothetical protein